MSDKASRVTLANLPALFAIAVLTSGIFGALLGPVAGWIVLFVALGLLWISMLWSILKLLQAFWLAPRSRATSAATPTISNSPSSGSTASAD